MAVTAASFLVAFPEFAPMHSEDAALVPAVLARAELRVGNIWRENLRDHIVELTCAHMLAMMPSGRNAKLSMPGAKTAYQEDLCMLAKSNAFGKYRVV
jgi:hypothetical protein